MRPFRVLWVDDRLVEGLTFPFRPSAQSRPHHAETVLDQVYECFQRARASGGPAEFYVSADLLLDPKSSVRAIYPEGAQWRPEFRDELDVLILDIGGFPMWDADRVTNREFPHADPAELVTLNADYPGAAFYLRNRQRLRSCQAVIILSVFDGGNAAQSQQERALVERYLDPCCCPDPGADGPHTVKHPRNRFGFGKVADIVQALYLDYSDGYTRLTHRSAIEFAATHDFPVVIVGESGTGKEYIANAIHRRWVQEHRNRYTHPHLQIINCGGLSEQLAHSQLFGQVRGSFTSAEDHRLGYILKACGCNGFGPTPQRVPDNGWQQHFAEQLRFRNPNLLTQGDAGLEFVPDHCMGTLFLDEFGELPLGIQTLLLRYLQTAEIQPLGYDGLIKGARTRIIVASSDPRIGQFFGVKLKWTSRSTAELDRALRDDLLFRVKGPVIRAEPVTADNISAILKDLLDRRFDTGAPQWDQSALKTVVDAVEGLDRAGDGSVRAAFGHVRELKGIIQLADAYVHHAAGRGLRAVGNVVTGEIVDRVWRPSVGMMMPSEDPRQEVQHSTAAVEARGNAAPRQLTLGNLLEGLRDVPLDPKDPALKGSKAKLEEGVEALKKRLAGAAITLCRSVVENPSHPQVVSYLEADDVDGVTAARTLNKLAGRSNDDRKVAKETLADLVAAWEQGPHP